MSRIEVGSFLPWRSLDVPKGVAGYVRAHARFVRLRNGRRSVCFGCERPAADEIESEDVGALGGPQ